MGPILADHEGTGGLDFKPDDRFHGGIMLIHVVIGTDTYGRVKVVDGLPVVTKFFMLQVLPVWPMQSFYLLGRGKSTRSGVPFVVSGHEVVVEGIPLARVDWVSVGMAYLRGVLGGFAIVGSIFTLVGGYSWLLGGRTDEFGRILLMGMLGVMIVGVVGGLLTYVIPTATQRERAIRRACGAVLGVAIDPARVAPEVREEIATLVSDLAEAGDDPRLRSILELIQARLDLAGATDPTAEFRSDEWLERLRSAEPPMV